MTIIPGRTTAADQIEICNRVFQQNQPYSLTHEQVSPTSDNYAFFDTLVEIELAGNPAS